MVTPDSCPGSTSLLSKISWFIIVDPKEEEWRDIFSIAYNFSIPYVPDAEGRL